MHMVRELVREDDLDFIFRIIRQQRIGQQDAPRLAQAGQRRVGLPRVVAQHPLEHADDVGARAGRERHQPIDQRRAIERLELVEDRQQHHRRQPGEADHRDGEHQRGDPPPLVRRTGAAPRTPRRCRRRRAPGRAPRPSHDRPANRPRRLRRQSVAMLEQVALVEGERKFDDLQDHYQQDRQHDHVHRVVKPARRPLRDRRRKLTQPMTAAEDRHSQQHNAGSRRPQEVGAPAQAMVSGGLVFVQISSQSTSGCWLSATRAYRRSPLASS